MNKNEEWVGKDINLFKSLSKKLQCTAKIIHVPFGESFKLLSSGHIDVMSQLSHLEERKKNVWFLGPIRKESIGLVTLNNVPFDISKLEQIERLPSLLAKQSGTFLGSEFDYLYNNNINFQRKFFLTTSSTPRIDLVIKRRVIGFLGIKEHLLYELSNNTKYNGMKIHSLELNPGVVFLGFNKSFITPEKEKVLTEWYNEYVDNVNEG